MFVSAPTISSVLHPPWTSARELARVVAKPWLVDSLEQEIRDTADFIVIAQRGWSNPNLSKDETSHLACELRACTDRISRLVRELSAVESATGARRMNMGEILHPDVMDAALGVNRDLSSPDFAFRLHRLLDFADRVKVIDGPIVTDPPGWMRVEFLVR